MESFPSIIRVVSCIAYCVFLGLLIKTAVNGPIKLLKENETNFVTDTISLNGSSASPNKRTVFYTRSFRFAKRRQFQTNASLINDMQTSRVKKQQERISEP